MLFNLQILSFIDGNKVKDFYKKITKKFSSNKCKSFFDYYRWTWQSSKCPVRLWNFNDIIKNKNVDDKFYFTNILTENINRYLNNNLKRSKCSKKIFRQCILNIILQFSNILVNNTRNTNKTEILKFYIKQNDANLLNKEEIEKLNQAYNELDFYNINEKYSDCSNWEPELNVGEDENSSE